MEKCKTQVYLVGNAESTKNNSWLHMTNSLDAAKELLQGIPEGVLKVLVVEQGAAE